MHLSYSLSLESEEDDNMKLKQLGNESNILGLMKSRRLEFAEHVVRMSGEM